MNDETNSNEDYILYIREKLDDRVILEQLAEEAAELSQACLKLIRASGFSKNVTPTDRGKALSNLYEEMSDVSMCYFLLFGRYHTRESIVRLLKWERWARRLGYPGEGEKQNG